VILLVLFAVFVVATAAIADGFPNPMANTGLRDEIAATPVFVFATSNAKNEVVGQEAITATDANMMVVEATNEQTLMINTTIQDVSQRIDTAVAMPEKISIYAGNIVVAREFGYQFS